MYKDDKKYENYAYILDYLPHGRILGSGSVHSVTGVLQLIGESYFTILESLPKRDIDYIIQERIYVGKNSRTSIGHIIGRINYKELTPNARAELPSVLETIIIRNEDAFIKFFNQSQPVTPRMHSLELIPGIGKRLMFQIIEKRERMPFKSYDDIRKRVNVSDPVKLISRRIVLELKGNEKYNLFVRTRLV